MSIRMRMTAWYCLLLAVVILGLGTFLVLRLSMDLRDAVDDEARASTAAILADVLDTSSETDSDDAGADPQPDDAAEPEDDVEELNEAARAVLPPGAGAVQLLDGQGRVRAQYGAVADDQPLASGAARRAAGVSSATSFTARLGDQGQRYRVRVTAFSDRGEVGFLVVALSLQRVENDVRRVLFLLLIAGPTVLAGTALSAYWLACVALRPVHRMTSDAQEIGTDRLHERVAVPRANDEIGRLAVTLNAMLERIERGVTQKRQLFADASHELRTPLAVMRAEIDVSLRGDALPRAAVEVLGSTRDEVDRMTRTVDNLLTLAEADQGRLELLTVRVRLDQAAEDAARPLTPLAAAKGVTMRFEGGPWDAQADPHRLHLALTNLTENAIKFTAPGGCVRITSWRRDDEVGVTVTDDGPGIDPDDRERLFERFYRDDSARGRRIRGSGLGLAICHEVALAHGGRVWVDSEVGTGSAFSLALPGWRSRSLEE